NNNANNNNANNNNNDDDENNRRESSSEKSESEEEIQDIFSYIAQISNTQGIEDPRSYYEAMKRDDAEEWKEGRRVEERSLKMMETFDEVKEVPKECKIIDSKFILTTKRDENGNEIRKKARLVARGDRQ